MGRMGLAHYSILNTHPDVTPVAMCDKSKQALRILSRGGGVETFTDVDRMLEEVSLDCLVVSTPSDSHAALISKGLERDLHVFVEKPFCLLPEEGRRVLELLDGKGVVNQVGYVNRFNDVFLEVKRLLAGGTIGPIVHFKFEMYGRTVTRDQKGGWRAEHAKGGGCMYEFASHCIDLVNYLVGPPQRVTGTLLHSIVSEKVEDVVSSSLLYDNGCCGTVLVNWCDPTFRKPCFRARKRNSLSFTPIRSRLDRRYLTQNSISEKSWSSSHSRSFFNSTRRFWVSMRARDISCRMACVSFSC